ncbi:hypothetical protein, partial [Brevibacillus brevis]|uniref:hypothetical protein n=1 Tax=Brevibacillus brevis TaxID=1393 RepID=UPI0037CAB808
SFTSNLDEPPYTERYVRWCERTGASHPLLLDFCRYVHEAKSWEESGLEVLNCYLSGLSY